MVYYGPTPPAKGCSGTVASMRAFLLLTVLAACGGSKPTTTQVEIDPLPEPMTRGVLSGPLCSTEACMCRAEGAAQDGGAGVPESAELKRFEFRVGPTENALWVMVDEMVLYKTDEHAQDCFYIDLPKGQHKVTLRARRPGGLSAKLGISEYAPGVESWYETFRFECGIGGTCSNDELHDYRDSLEQYKQNLHDPCGSTKIKQIGWDSGQAPDQAHPEDLQLELTLDVYGFEPEHAHGDPACASGE